MSASEDNTHILDGIEKYRDPFQLLIGTNDLAQAYDTETEVYELMENDEEVSTEDEIRISEYFCDFEYEEAYEFLEGEVF